MALGSGSRMIALGSIWLLVPIGVVLCAPPPGWAAGEPGFGCKRAHGGKATINPSHGSRPPILIGDSTVLLAISNLNGVGYSVNARGCRGFEESVEVALKLRAKHRLPHLVLINDYGNGGVTPERIQEALDVIGNSRVLGLVTEYDADTGRPPAPDTDVLYRAENRFPHRIVVLDWVKHSIRHHKAEPKPGAWFLPDLFHPNFAGAAAYAQFLAEALPLARGGAFPPLP